MQNKKKHQNHFEIPKAILNFGKFLQAISKDAAAKFAAKIFATPVKIKAPERELMMRKSTKQHRLVLEKAKSEIEVYEYGYSKTRILLVHGWAGRGTQLYHLADKLLENKMMVISFDAPAHGLSEGKRTNMFEFVEAIKAVEKNYGPFHAAIGHSFGGMSLINSIAGGLRVNKLVTIGADNSIPQIFRYFVKKLELKPEIAVRLTKMFESKYHIKVDDLTSEHQAEKVNVPTLVIHDSDDKYVHVSSATAIRQKLEKGQLLITNNLGHHKIFKDDFVLGQIIKFIQ